MYKHERYENMQPKSNQPGLTHKIDSIDDVTLDQLKLHPVIDQTGTYNLQRIKSCSNIPKATIQEQVIIMIHY